MLNRKNIKTGFLLILITLIMTSCNDFGEKITYKGANLHYKSPVTLDEAKMLGEYLEEIEFFDGTSKTLQLNKNEDVWILKVIIKKGMEEDEEYIDMIRQFSRELSYNVFEEKEVEIHLCDKKMQTLKVVVAI